MTRYKTQLQRYLESKTEPNDTFGSVYDWYGESDGKNAVGELVDVKLPDGSWEIGAIIRMIHEGGPYGGKRRVSVHIKKGTKQWIVEVFSNRDIESRGRMRPERAWVGSGG